MKRTGFRSFLTCLSAVWVLTLMSSFGVTARAQQPTLQDLPDPLRSLDIQARYMPTEAHPRVGVVHALQGVLVVVHPSDRGAFVASEGDPVHENDELFTLDDSRCRIRFQTEDVVNMAPETRFSVERFVDDPELGEKTSIFGLLRGKAMFYALRLFQYRETRFRVKTPTATVGVRGTQFGMHVFLLDEERAGSEGIQVADRRVSFSSYLAQAGEDAATGTIVACGDGQLDITDPATGQRMARLNPNEDFNTRTRQKTFDPQNRTLNGIAADTRVREEGEEDAGDGRTGAETQEPSQEEDASVEEDASGPPATDGTDLVTDVTIQETGNETQTEESRSQPEESDRPSRYFGYFNGILSRESGGSPLTGGYYFTPGIANLDGAGTAKGMREGADVGTMTYDGAGAPGVKSITGLTHQGNTVDQGVPVDVDYWEYGHDSYMEWGIWTTYYKPPMVDTDTGIEHSFKHRGYYFAGEHTTDSQMAALHGSLGEVTYSGRAWGKHYQQSAGLAMEGGFTAKVDFGSPSVTDFDMQVSGNGHSASIADAQGGFAGSSSQFELNTATGTWKVDGAAAQYKHARGGLFGDQGQKMGVIWAVKESSANSQNTAWGMCVGAR